eukprot:358298-Chlamydomonas_euryale.AAC.7
MRGPERLPFCEIEAGWSVHKTCAKAEGRGLPRLAGVMGRNSRPSQACFVKGRPCQGFTKG